MKNEALYNKTVGILVDAYFNDTLESSNCHACAVGNLIAANMGFSIKRNPFGGLEWDNDKPMWHKVHVLLVGTRTTSWGRDIIGQKQIRATGYTKKQTAAMERAFELAYRDTISGDNMFNGLMAVIEVLDQIHENTDEAVTTASKRKFNKELCVQVSDTTQAK